MLNFESSSLLHREILVCQLADDLAESLVSLDGHGLPLVVVAVPIDGGAEVEVRVAHHWSLCVGGARLSYLIAQLVHDILPDVLRLELVRLTAGIPGVDILPVWVVAAVLVKCDVV